MRDATGWMKLIDGFPREPEHGNLEELTALPGPPRFLLKLFDDLCGIDVSRHKKVATQSNSADGVRETQFINGTDEIGYSQKETVFSESSDFPIGIAVKTFGLPGIEIAWDYELPYQGQLGHCGFRHRYMLARFETAQSKAQFADVWTKVFGVAPKF